MATKTVKRRKPDPEGRAYRKAAYQAALAVCGPIKPCGDCGWPTVVGYLCGCGGSADRNAGSFGG